jgi:hypothetical protein
VFSNQKVSKILTQVVTWRDDSEKAGEIEEQQTGEQELKELCSKRWQLLYAVSLSFSAVSLVVREAQVRRAVCHDA